MGDYTGIRGTVKIKPEFIEILRPRLDPNAPGHEDAYPEWKTLGLPEELTNTEAFDIMAAGYTPSASSAGIECFDGDEEEGRMEYTEDGVLTFYQCSKNTGHHMEGFIEFICGVAVSWVLQLDIHEWSDNWEHPEKDFTTFSYDPVTNMFVVSNPQNHHRNMLERMGVVWDKDNLVSRYNTPGVVKYIVKGNPMSQAEIITDQQIVYPNLSKD